MKGLDIPAEQHSIIHGDALSYLIGAASIAAKVKRDTYMCQMAEKYPEYGFERNKGYGTAEHIAALKNTAMPNTPHELYWQDFGEKQ
ncbi:MAG: hypothetical protein V8Q85_06635 [Christensenellales bacterium]